MIGFARLNGRAVGIVANNPAYMAGCLDIDASVKGARSSASATPSTSPWWCSRRSGFMPGTAQEYGASSVTVPNSLYAFCEATVPS